MMRILIAEDEAHNRDALSAVLKKMGHEIVLAVDGQEALEMSLTAHFDLILSDIRMPKLDGFQFFDAVQRLSTSEGTPPFAFMTGYGRLEEAVEALKKGAIHFLSKPLRKKDLVSLTEEVASLAEKRQGKKQALAPATSEIVYASKSMSEIMQTIDKVASSQASVLLIGESGTGKEVFAKRLHEQSARAKQSLVVFHSGAMPETLFESELFGYEKGAFTGADHSYLGRIRTAHHGTFFLDELATMPPAAQAKLLRVIQDGVVTPLGSTRSHTVDVRWVAATNSNLQTSLFREDLFYRLAVVVIQIPPLRERIEDIEVLSNHFMREFADRDSRDVLTIPEATKLLLETYSWPGNVRELKNVVERAFVLSTGTEFTPDLLPAHIAQVQKSREIKVVVGSSLQSTQKRLIEETLRSCDGDKSRAAAILGVTVRTIYRWIEREESKNSVSV